MTSFLARLVGVGSVKLISRGFHRSCRLNALGSGSYEGDGKTTVTILNVNYEYGLMIDIVTNSGFKLNTGTWIMGPLIIFPKSVVSWNIGSSDEINEDSLTLLKVLAPPLDLLIFGVDRKYDSSVPFIKTVKNFTKKMGMQLELLPVEQACTTFNFLNAENRYIAAALLPPVTQLPKGIKMYHHIKMRRDLSKSDKEIASD